MSRLNVSLELIEERHGVRRTARVRITATDPGEGLQQAMLAMADRMAQRAVMARQPKTLAEAWGRPEGE